MNEEILRELIEFNKELSIQTHTYGALLSAILCAATPSLRQSIETILRSELEDCEVRPEREKVLRLALEFVSGPTDSSDDDKRKLFRLIPGGKE